MDSRITDLASRQHGQVGRRQLIAAGLPVAMIDAAVHEGRLQRDARGVYSVPGVPETAARELMTAVLRCGPDAFVVGERLLAICRVQGASPTGSFAAMARPGRRLSNVPWTWRARPEDWPGPRIDVDRVPSTDVTWNLLEAAVDVSTKKLERLADGVRWLGPGKVRAVRGAVTAHAGSHPGAHRIAELGLFAEGAPESAPERRLLPALAHHAPVTQAEVLAGIFVDLFIPQARVVIEYDGFATHSSPRDVAADTERRRRLEAAGYVVVVVRADDLQDLDGLVAQIDALVALRVRG